MIPFFPQPAIRIGSRHITAFSVLLVAGIVIGRTIIIRRGRRFGFTYAEIAPVYLTMLVSGLAGAVAAQVILTWMRATLEPGLGLASIGGLAAGLPAGLLVCWFRRWSLARTVLLLDVVAFATPFASCVARLGCALAHDHRGLPSNTWFAVRFPEGGRYDLALLEFAFLAALSILFVILDRWTWPPGFFFALAGILYGGFRLWRETLDVAPHFTPWCLVMVAGAAMAIWLLRARENSRVPHSASAPAVD